MPSERVVVATTNGIRVRLEFSGTIWHWRGPAPFHFVTLPEAECAEIKSVASAVSYGWGMIPVTATIGDTRWRTALFPKEGHYLLPIKDAVRKAEGMGIGDVVHARLELW
jgi:hypothetical protein